MKRPSPNNVFVYCRVNPNKLLVDHRPRKYGLVFGRIVDVARQYGVKMEELPTCLRFYAPKSRMQMFVEKLHFSLVPYSQRPL